MEKEDKLDSSRLPLEDLRESFDKKPQVYINPSQKLRKLLKIEPKVLVIHYFSSEKKERFLSFNSMFILVHADSEYYIFKDSEWSQISSFKFEFEKKNVKQNWNDFRETRTFYKWADFVEYKSILKKLPRYNDGINPPKNKPKSINAWKSGRMTVQVLKDKDDVLRFGRAITGLSDHKLEYILTGLDAVFDASTYDSKRYTFYLLKTPHKPCFLIKADNKRSVDVVLSKKINKIPEIERQALISFLNSNNFEVNEDNHKLSSYESPSFFMFNLGFFPVDEKEKEWINSHFYNAEFVTVKGSQFIDFKKPIKFKKKTFVITNQSRKWLYYFLITGHSLEFLELAFKSKSNAALEDVFDLSSMVARQSQDINLVKLVQKFKRQNN
jgi:hypothetical protein